MFDRLEGNEQFNEDTSDFHRELHIRGRMRTRFLLLPAALEMLAITASLQNVLLLGLTLTLTIALLLDVLILLPPIAPSVLPPSRLRVLRRRCVMLPTFRVASIRRSLRRHAVLTLPRYFSSSRESMLLSSRSCRWLLTLQLQFHILMHSIHGFTVRRLAALLAAQMFQTLSRLRQRLREKRNLKMIRQMEGRFLSMTLLRHLTQTVNASRVFLHVGKMRIFCAARWFMVQLASPIYVPVLDGLFSPTSVSLTPGGPAFAKGHLMYLVTIVRRRWLAFLLDSILMLVPLLSFLGNAVLPSIPAMVLLTT